MNAVSRAGIKRTREGAGRTSEVGQPDITPILGTPARPWQSERPVAHSRVPSPHLANGDIYVRGRLRQLVAASLLGAQREGPLFIGVRGDVARRPRPRRAE